MNCESFSAAWNRHVATTNSAADESQMQEHARECTACGKLWRDHDELAVSLDSVINANRLPPQLTGTIIDMLKLPTRPRKAQPPEAVSFPAGAPATPLAPLAAAALVGLIFGYMLAGTGMNRGNAGLEQALLMQSMNFASMPGTGGALLLSGMGNAVLDVFGILTLIWLTRSSAWEIVYPVQLPQWLAAARWLAVPAILLGGLRILLSLFAAAVAWNNLGAGFGGGGLLVATLQFIQPLWTLAFWLTLLVMFFGAINDVFVRSARPLQ